MRGSPGSRLLAVTSMRFAPLLERLLQRPFPARVQRIGAQALSRVAARFPAVAELVGLLRPQRPAANVAHVPEVELAPAAALPAEAWLEQLEHGSSWQLRCQAAAQLATVEAPSALEALLTALRDPSAEVAAAAVEALAHKQDPRVVRTLEEVLENRSGYFSPIVRAAAVQGLARVRADMAPVIAAVLDVDAEVSLAAIAALAQHAPERAREQLLGVLQDRAGYFLPLVRLSAAKALVASSPAPDVTERLLASELDPAVRSVLATAS